MNSKSKPKLNFPVLPQTDLKTRKGKKLNYDYIKYNNFLKEAKIRYKLSWYEAYSIFMYFKAVK
jgi:hypothetical protein